MKSVWVSLAVAVALMVGTPLLSGWGWYSGIAPGLVFGLITFGAIWWRVSQAVQAEMAAFQGMAASLGQPTDEAGARALMGKLKGELTRIRDAWGDWQPLLWSGLTGQLGVLEYQQLDFDAALPLLEQGSAQDAPARIALACVYFRRDRFADMDRAFGEAATAQPKEPMVYALWAVLCMQKDRREQGLAAVGQGLTALPGHALLTALRDQIANKKPVSTQILGEAWWQYFPDRLRALLSTPLTAPLDPAIVATLPAPVRAQYEAALAPYKRQEAAAQRARASQQRRYPAARS
jgi:tetratricopeptide (TPR) repeat protein